MKAVPVFIVLVACVGVQLLGTRLLNAAPVCPSPMPVCTSRGNLADLLGTFGCSGEERHADGTSHVNVALVTFNGKGGVTGKIALNSNKSTPPTFQPFVTLPFATYCLNIDDTGYVYPGPAGGACPLAIIIDQTKNAIRAMGSAETRAGITTCTRK